MFRVILLTTNKQRQINGGCHVTSLGGGKYAFKNKCGVARIPIPPSGSCPLLTFVLSCAIC